MPDLSSMSDADLQSIAGSKSAPPASSAPVVAPQPAQQPQALDISKMSDADLQSIANKSSPQNTDLPSKVLAATGSVVGGALHGIGKTIEAIPNLGASFIQSQLDLLNKAGIVPDSLSSGFKSATDSIKSKAEDMGQKVLDYQQSPATADEKANPLISAVGNFAGDVVGSSAVAGRIIGDLGKGLNAVSRGIVNQGAQGALMGAGANSDNPFQGAATGGVLGAVGGAIAGKLGRSADIIKDKQDSASLLGNSPYSEAGINATKGALDNGGKDLTQEELQATAKSKIQATLDQYAPKIDIKQSPQDMIVNMAKANLPEVKAQNDALYDPLNKSTAPIQTSNLDTTIASLKNKQAINSLPTPLKPDSTIGDMMAYRRNVASELSGAQRAVQMGTGNFKTVDELYKIKNAVTTDLNASATKVGLGDQLAKADNFNQNQLQPFKVYDTDTGKLKSDSDINQAWGKVSKLLLQKRPNANTLNDLSKVASTLGPQGKQVVGYAYLQQTINSANIIDGRIRPSTIMTGLSKLQNSGLGSKILTPELQEAFNGMHALAEAALKESGGKPDVSGILSKTLNYFTHNTGGILALRALGSKTAPAAKVKNLASQILLNGIEHQAGLAQKQQNQ